MVLGLYAIMSGGYVLLKEGHVTMDVVVAKLSPRVKAILAMIAFSLFFITVCALVYYGTLEALESVSMKEKINSAWSPPLYPLKIFWPIGAFLLLLQGIATFIRYLNTARSKGGSS
jgi:TRAP-type mannitol/chloroaromatic compound transport system permease small subunit